MKIHHIQNLRPNIIISESSGDEEEQQAGLTSGMLGFVNSVNNLARSVKELVDGVKELTK